MLPPRLPFAIDTRRLRSFDGTELAYHVTRAPRPDAPWIVLAGGLAGGVRIFAGIIDYLRDRYRFATWDLRGLGGGGRGRSPRPPEDGSGAVARHARDLEALLAAERIDRCGLVGWSAGVQVLLAAAPRLAGGKAHSLVLVDGAAGRPLDAIAPVPVGGGAFVPILRGFRRLRATLPGARRPIGRRLASFWIDRLRLVGRSADPAAVAALTASVADLDEDAFLRELTAFAAHDARGSLASLDLPVLIVAGDRDPIVPRAAAQQMARALPRAELLLVEGGGHTTPIEFPELIALRIERFYQDHGL